MQMLKYIMQVQHMLFRHWAEHKDIIKVDSHAMHQVGERQIHQTWEHCRCIAQSYGDYKVFKHSCGVKKVVFCPSPHAYTPNGMHGLGL